MARYQTLEINSKKPKNLMNDDSEDDFEIEIEEDDEEGFSTVVDEEDEDEGFETDDEEETEEGTDDEGDSEDDSEGTEAEEDEDLLPKTRENDRIRTLIEERKATEARLKEEQKKRIEAEKRSVEVQKNTVKTTISLISDQISSLKTRLINAKKEGETELEMELQEKLTKAQMDKAALESWKAPVVEDLEDDEEEVTAQTNKTELKEPPKSVKDWVNKNVWFTNPRTEKDLERRKEAAIYSELLIKEGYNIETKEFFDLIDKRMEKLGLAKTEKTKVESKQNNSSQGRKTENTSKKISQTVQGGNRTAASQTKSPTKIKLTAEQREIAELYGMTEKEYARELLKIEAARKQGKRMVTIDT